MSRETTEARFGLRQAEQDWKGHLHDCPRCASAVRSRHLHEICGDGHLLLGARRDAQRELTENRRLDKQPGPDAMPLF